MNLGRFLSLASEKTTLLVLLIAVISFNNWLLGPLLNPHLFSSGGSVSDFSVVGQPYSVFFRSADALAGLLFIVFGILVLKKLHPSRSRNLLIAATIGLGAANCIDAVLPLNCAIGYASCNLPISLSPNHFSLPHHAYSSIIIGLTYLLLPLGGFLYGLEDRLRTFTIASAFMILVALLSVASAIGEYIVKSSLSVHTWGFTQEFQMMFIGLWFLSWYFADNLDNLLLHQQAMETRRDV